MAESINTKFLIQIVFLISKYKKKILIIAGRSYDCYGYINQNVNPYFPFMYFSENIGLVRKHRTCFYYFERNRYIEILHL